MTVIVADSTTLARQFRRWQPFLAVPGDTKWPHDGSTITDPATDAMTKAERRTARLAAWRAHLDGYTNSQIKDLGYNAFESWAKPCKALFAQKIRSAMGNPTATLAQMRVWVRDEFSLLELGTIAPDWAVAHNCSGSLHMASPGIGTTSAFGAPVTAAAWSHPFTEIQLHWLEALIRSRGQQSHFLLLEALPDDWEGAEA